MALLDHAYKCRSWLTDQPFDAELDDNDIAEVAAKSWISTTPMRVFRFALVTALGFGLSGPVGAGLGLALGAADQLPIDRMVAGYKPNQFINKHLDPFVDAD